MGNRITIKALKEKYPDFEITGNYKSSYNVIHLPTGKHSVCILGRKLESIERFIQDSIENKSYLNNRSHYRLPNE